MTAVAVFYPMRPPRLHRLEQVFLRQPLYFITLCASQRRKIIDQRDIHDAFLTFCQAASARGIFVGRYVLMPDHLHLFVTLAAADATPSTWVKTLKNSLSKIWRTSGVAAPHWQKGFFDHILRSTDSYDEKWRYVAANPVRAGLVTTSEAWPYQGTIHELHF